MEATVLRVASEQSLRRIRVSARAGRTTLDVALGTRDNGAVRVRGAVRPPGTGTVRFHLTLHKRAPRPLDSAQGRGP